MDTDTDLPVKLGAYINQVSGRWLWLLPSNRAGIAVQALGIWLTIALPRIWVAAVTLYRGGISPNEQQEASVREGVLDPGEYALDRLWDAGLPRNRLPDAVLPRRDKRTALRDFGVAVAVASIFLLIIVLGTLTNLLSGDSTAVLVSKNCGYYDINKDAPFELWIPHFNSEKRKQETVAAYASDCYGGQANSITGCNLFTQQSLPYTTEVEVPCPFKGGMCILGDEKGAVRFLTPPIPANHLGLNINTALEFRRITTCAPLVRNESFQLYKESTNPLFTGFWLYQYGQADAVVGYTFLYPERSNFVSDGTYTAQPISERGNNFQPIQELRTPEDSILTLMFIDVSRLSYFEKVVDPIFQALDVSRNPIQSNETGWVNEVWNSVRHWRDIAPRVLACVDGFNIRNRRESERWSNSVDPPERDGATNEEEWRLLHSVLEKSTVHEVTSMRSGDALRANSAVFQGTLGGMGSLGLPHDQWKIEARGWFEASLANIQFQVRRIGLGLDASDPMYIKRNGSESICSRMFLVKAAGYTNVLLAPWLTIWIWSLFVILATFPWGPREHRKLAFEFIPEPVLRPLTNCCVAVVSFVDAAVHWTSKILGSLAGICWSAAKAFCTFAGASVDRLWRTSVHWVQNAYKNVTPFVANLWKFTGSSISKLWNVSTHSMQRVWIVIPLAINSIYKSAANTITTLWKRQPQA